MYACDQCDKILSDSEYGIAHKHLSIVLGNYSGWVQIVKSSRWEHTKKINGIFHFCDEKCLAKFFKELNKE